MEFAAKTHSSRKVMKAVPFSVLDLSPIKQGETASDAFRNSLDLAQNAERLGYSRHWMAEHHGMPGIASAATSVIISHIAAGTSTIRVGAGGIMLPNHAPLVIAEQFGTLESLYPGRIDLALGRAPGTDRVTTTALRRSDRSADTFPQDVIELQSYFETPKPGQAVLAVPGAGLDVPIWLLGSSMYSAQLAAELGLPFAFASHFAPDYMMHALQAYRTQFKPSDKLDRPYAMLGLSVVAAESDGAARRLFTSLQQQFVNLRRGTPGQIQPPVDSMDGYWTSVEKAQLEHSLAYAVVGSAESVNAQIARFIEFTNADELMITAQIYDHEARVRSYELTAQSESMEKRKK
jgi:luciferase family oxidoreductase group 1